MNVKLKPDMEILKFKPDGKLRRQFYHSTSLSHPAKAHLGMMLEIISRYTKEGETILDPMAGIGGTMMAALMGRSVILVEKEQHFVEQMRASWAKMRQNPMLGCELGQVMILRGDARALPLGRVDDNTPICPNKCGPWLWDDKRKCRVCPVCGCVGLDKSLGQVDAAVFSPPYADTDVSTPKRHDFGGGIGNHPEVHWSEWHEHPGYTPGLNTQDNIGNLRGPAYWEAMRQVYAECHRVLAPGGLMVLVVKGFTRDGQYVDLPAQTQALCETLGFSFVETWQRELWSLSFWRILQGSEKKVKKMGLQMGLTEEDIVEIKREWRVSNGRLDDRLRYETVLALRREA